MELYISLLAAGHRPPPLVDIDATVFIQFGIFMLLLIILTKFVFRPYLELSKERSKNIEGARQEAEQLDQDADQKIGAYEEKVLTARKEAAGMRAEVRAEGEGQATDLLSSAHSKSDAKLEESRQKIVKTVQAAQLSLRTRADQIAKVVAHKLLGREV